MIRLSSNWTLFLKIFLPVFWLSFFGGFALASFVSDEIEVPYFTSFSFQWKIILFIVSGIIFFGFTFFRLKRVDGDDSHIYISNYFKTYRYEIEAIKEIVIYDHLVLKATHLYFNGKSSLGRKVIFLPYMINLKEYCDANNIILRDYKREH
ncbi:MAG: hypothetical protein R2771_08385 [Saprospiraceae bacterium]